MTEENNNLSIKEKEEEVLKFIKDAFVIDGEVELVLEPIVFNSYVKCHDSRRGIICIAFQKEAT